MLGKKKVDRPDHPLIDNKTPLKANLVCSSECVLVACAVVCVMPAVHAPGALCSCLARTQAVRLLVHCDLDMHC